MPARTMAALIEDRVHTPQCTFAFAEAGDGPPILLLHGGASSHHEWDGVMPLLAEGHRVLAPDRPGCGQSTRPREGFGRTTQGRAINLFLKAVGEERLTLVGHGLGGFLAIEIAAAMPYTVDRLVLLSPVTGALDGRERRLTSEEALAERALYGSQAASARERAERVAESFLPLERRQSFVEAQVRDAASADPSLVAEMLAEAGRAPDGVLLRSFRSPTLVIRGERDQTLSPERAARIASLVPDGRIAEIPGVGHFAHIEAPSLVAQAILDFLSSR